MNFSEFKTKAKEQTAEYDYNIGRIHNKDAIGNWVRELSYYLTYGCYKIGLRGQHVLFLHVGFDLVALYYVAIGQPLWAFAFWAAAHIADNVDGSLSRIRGEADMKWGEFDIFLHLWANILFWIILALRTDLLFSAMILLGARVVQEYFRQKQTNETRYGERSKIWKFITWPTNVNMIYLSYVIFALWGLVDLYLALYATYFLLAAVGQSTVYVFKTVK